MMKRAFDGSRLALALVVAVPIAVALGWASGPGAFVASGFTSGADFLDLPRSSRAMYARGMVDGISLAAVLRSSMLASDGKLGCPTGMSDVQIAALIEKYLRDNPEQWHQGANVATVNALAGMCSGLAQGREPAAPAR